MHVQAKLRARRGDRAAEVRLRSCGGHNTIGAGFHRFGHQRLSLAGLVATERKTTEVFALDEDRRATQRRR